LALAVVFGFSLLPVAVSGASLTLYDGSLGTLPGDQGFIYAAFALGASQSLTIDGTILNTLPITADYAGYVARPELVPILDRTGGYTINFTVQILAETHTSSDRNGDGQDDRAGFSVTALSSDSEGIELGFWENEIWAQGDGDGEPAPLLTHAEGVTFTTTALTSYQLAIQGNSYTLSASGTPILSGSLRNYSAFVPPLGAPNPYTSTNFLSLGDNSSSARARIKLAAVSISTNTATSFVPINTVTISGPTNGDTNAPYTFTVTVSPISATHPIIYTWQVSDQTPVTHTNNLSDTIGFSWSVTGTKQITVTAYNGITPVSDTHTITITANLIGDPPPKIYLPLILKKFSSSSDEHAADLPNVSP
jgi:hypothetical protein